MVKDGELDYLVAERVWQETQKALTEPSPSEYFRVLKRCGALKVVFPELERLFGVPQPAAYHPEIDTGIHILMVLDQACALSTETEVRFAALCHDLGKGITPADHWPSHRGHEQLGVNLVDQLCQRLRVHKQHQQLAKLVAEFHTHCHRIQAITPKKIYKLLKRLDAFRKPEQLQHFILCCQADAQGRSGLQHHEYPQGQFLTRAYEVANEVQAKALIDQGFTGKALGEKIDRERVTRIAQEKENWPSY